MTERSDMVRLCDSIGVVMGSCFSICGESRGDAVRKEFEMVDEGVGSINPVFGEGLTSAALSGVTPPDLADAGVVSGVRLDLKLSLRGAGEPLRSMAGDFGGTWGGNDGFTVSTLSNGFAPGLRIGESGRPEALIVSWEKMEFICCARTGEGPVIQEVIASPKGPALQFVPGAL